MKDRNEFAAFAEKTLSFIGKYVDEHGYSPTIREIAKHVGYTSTSTTTLHLTRLKQQGRLTWDEKTSRSIRLCHSNEDTVYAALIREMRSIVHNNNPMELCSFLARIQLMEPMDAMEWMEHSNKLVKDVVSKAASV